MTTQNMVINKSLAISEGIWATVAAVVSIAVGLLAWRFGASWTIGAIRGAIDWNGPVTTNSPYWYGVPLFFSGIQLAYWKLHGRLVDDTRGIAHVMTGVDMVTTIAGLTLFIISGLASHVAAIPLITIGPGAMPWLYAASVLIAIIVGWWVTLHPERLIVDGILQMYEFCRLLYILRKVGP